jgi:hypothetical protein
MASSSGGLQRPTALPAAGHGPPGEADDAPAPARDDTQPLPPVPGPPDGPPPRTHPGRRWAAVAGVIVALLTVGLLIANGAIGRAAEERAAAHAAAALGGPVDVSLSGWPVGLRLLTGRPVDVRLAATDVVLPDGAGVVDRLELELDGVPVDFTLLDEPEPELRAAAGRFSVELGEDTVAQQLGVIGRLPLTAVELRSGVARLTVANIPVIDATADVEDGEIVFRPTAPFGAFAEVALRIEELPFGFQADDVTIRPGVLQLTGSATDVRLAPPR